MFENLNVYDILGYGVIGLGFLLAVLAFRLLSAEQKRDPRQEIIRAIYIFMVFSVVLCIIGFAAQVFDNHEATNSGQDQALADCEEEIDTLKENTLTLNELQILSGEFFKADFDRQETLNVIRNLVNRVIESDKEKQHYAYKLFRLEKQISNFGSNISLKIQADNRIPIYRQIQVILQEINFYNGPIDGSQQSTYNALVNFQTEYNKVDSLTVFQDYELGILGYRTLEAFRSSYRRLGS
ncbi:MAG: hypothetical protein KDF60_13650 [Calditrichaeota bacterium]|nr:hypothetical protein [Calditrichota bacterium]